MPKIIEGDFSTVTRAPRRARVRRAPPAQAPRALGLVSDWLYETFNYGDYSRDTEILTGDPPAKKAGVVAQVQAQYTAAVADLEAASAELDLAESNLLSISDDVAANGSGADLDAWNDAYARVIGAQSTRDSALQSAQTVAGWLQSAKAAFGLSGLGVLPVVPWALVAAIAAGASALYAAANAGNAIFNAWQINAWNAESLRRQQAGDAPLIGGPVLADTSGGISAGIGSAADIAQYAMWGLIAFLFVPPLLRALEGKK